ncbi:YeeE/YedE family protein [Antarcticibacterium flavum]|uniref:YeeE/YedE family protein n=1 Tax=Antarcticibacterium flavum TaxID=2058175 RepID=A0A5B7X1B5_9FLAO|nr:MULTISPECIES: YeeE/YedE thiosulfate transporter family protein [Antarcticibacterium]MCM4158617.1 YeeE/YedE family protein [Antarcticibacterium sp. W02-3]QCY68472.1 YeeE/YedE family protein [Antarcticibacterium flavum]
MNYILEPWPWYVAGPLIAGIMFLLLFTGKNFGMSSNLRTMCTIGGAGKKADFFDFNWKSQRWNLMVVVGAVLGGFIAANLLSTDIAVDINPDTVSTLEVLGFDSAGEAYLPNELFATNALTDPKALVILLTGGVLIGFGARYAGGCTSGHAISGLSNLQLPSLIAVVGFFIGGLVMIHLLFPLIF